MSSPSHHSACDERACVPEVPTVDLVIPVKSLPIAKSRFVDQTLAGSPTAHQRIVLAIVIDTVTAALASDAVGRIVVVTPDSQVAARVHDMGAQPVYDAPARGLNAALEHGEHFLRRSDPSSNVAALLADLPALRERELTAVIRAARGTRAFCPDKDETGTTLLLSGAGAQLNPRFGTNSAKGHIDAGAQILHGPWPSVRCDVDTLADLQTAAELGLGRETASLASLASRTTTHRSAHRPMVYPH